MIRKPPPSCHDCLWRDFLEKDCPHNGTGCPEWEWRYE